MGPSKFSFVDEGEALRQLGVDHDTLLSLVAEGRLRAYKGVGKGHFFKMADLQALDIVLHPPTPHAAAADAERAEAKSVPAESTAPARRQHDPAYKVHLRLVADLKWYDLNDADFQAWVRELHPEGYPRQRTNITNVIARLERLLALMDEAAAGWRNLPPDAPTPSR
jgi:hypothetical protein